MFDYTAPRTAAHSPYACSGIDKQTINHNQHIHKKECVIESTPCANDGPPRPPDTTKPHDYITQDNRSNDIGFSQILDSDMIQGASVMITDLCMNSVACNLKQIFSSSINEQYHSLPA